MVLANSQLQMKTYQPDRPLPRHFPPPLTKSWVTILWRQRWIVLVTTLLAIAVGWVILLKLKPIYSSSSRVLVERDRKVIISDGITETAQSTNYLATQCELIKSSAILSTVAQLPEIRSLNSMNGRDPLAVLLGGTRAEVNPKDDLIGISFESQNPADASDVVNAIVEAYRAYYAAAEKSSSAELRRILEKELQDRQEDLNAKVKESLDFRQSNPELSYNGEKGNIIIETLAKLSDALTSARLDTLEVKAAYEGSKHGIIDPAAMAKWSIGQATSSTANTEELQTLQSRLAVLKRTFGPKHSTVQALEAAIDDLQQRQSAIDGQAAQVYARTVAQRLNALEQRENELSQEFAAQQAKALSLNTVATRFATIENDRTRLEKLCDLLDTKIRDLNVNSEVNTRISVLEYARPGKVPVYPKPASVLLQSVFVGLLLGAGLAKLRDWTNHRITSADEVTGILGLEILAVTSHMTGSRLGSVERARTVQLKPSSEIAEGFRSLRTAIYFRAGESAKTIAITSANPGEGKSTTASNLAIAMAQTGQKILLLEADCRRPSQHHIFGISKPRVGLSSVLCGQATLEQAFHGTSVAGLTLLPCGPIPKDPAEQLNSQAFKDTLKELENRFDRIVIDTTPVVSVTDAIIVAAQANITVLVVRAQRSTRRAILHARDLLSSMGANILGVVVNDAPVRSTSYGYGYRYGYGYAYGYRQRNGARQLAKTESPLEAQPQA
jgi:capsular exopolysaccharide synthesis family protein